MKLFSKWIDRRLASYQRELIETHYREVDNMYRQIRVPADPGLAPRLPQPHPDHEGLCRRRRLGGHPDLS